MENCTSVTVCDNKLKENGDLNSSHVGMFVVFCLHRNRRTILRNGAKRIEREEEEERKMLTVSTPLNTINSRKNFKHIYQQINYLYCNAGGFWYEHEWECNTNLFSANM